MVTAAIYFFSIAYYLMFKVIRLVEKVEKKEAIIKFTEIKKQLYKDDSEIQLPVENPQSDSDNCVPEVLQKLIAAEETWRKTPTYLRNDYEQYHYCFSKIMRISRFMLLIYAFIHLTIGFLIINYSLIPFYSIFYVVAVSLAFIILTTRYSNKYSRELNQIKEKIFPSEFNKLINGEILD
jgi:Flp pilus assembly protein TadB